MFQSNGVVSGGQVAAAGQVILSKCLQVLDTLMSESIVLEESVSVLAEGFQFQFESGDAIRRLLGYVGGGLQLLGELPA
jgi:hypothetical protein